jgi:hypothetical protein
LLASWPAPFASVSSYRGRVGLLDKTDKHNDYGLMFDSLV